LLSKAFYYYIFFILCILNKKKRNLYKYICVYRKAKFENLDTFYTPFYHQQAARRSRAVSGNLPGASAAYFMFYFSGNVSGGSCGALARLKARRIFFQWGLCCAPRRAA